MCFLSKEEWGGVDVFSIVVKGAMQVFICYLWLCLQRRLSFIYPNINCFYILCIIKDGGVAVIEDSILEVLKQANKPRVLFII